VTTDAVLDEHSQFAQGSALSADGQSVAYTWFALDGKYELRVADIEGRRPRVLLRGEDVACPWPVEWSRDGRSILAILQKYDHSHQLALVSASDGTVRVVKHLGMTPPLHASLSPDSAYVVYDHPQQPNEFPRDIFIVGADGSSDWPLVRAPSADIAPVWAPDGAHVLFASDRSGAMDIWSVAVDRGTAQGEPEVIHRNVGRLLTQHLVHLVARWPPTCLCVAARPGRLRSRVHHAGHPRPADRSATGAGSGDAELPGAWVVARRAQRPRPGRGRAGPDWRARD
jgi:hypothetical protein